MSLAMSALWFNINFRLEVWDPPSQLSFTKKPSKRKLADWSLTWHKHLFEILHQQKLETRNYSRPCIINVFNSCTFMWFLWITLQKIRFAIEVIHDHEAFFVNNSESWYIIKFRVSKQYLVDGDNNPSKQTQRFATFHISMMFSSDRLN